MPVDTKAATDRLMRFLSVEGVTGQEAAIGRELAAALKESGVPAKAIRLDDANTRIPVPTETGNLIVDLPGRGALHNQPRIMFMTHMDTVPLCAGAKPKKSGRKIVNDARTALGGDNRCGCGVLVTLAAELARQKPDHPPITLLFCVREESGLYGARHVKLDELGAPEMAFNYDGGSASNVVIGAVGADRWTVEIFGRASHAGVAPERHLLDDDHGARACRGEGRRLVRQGGEGQAARHQQCRSRHRRRGPPRRRCHQCGHRLRACARREPQPRRKILQRDHQGLQGRVREGRQEGHQRARQVRSRQIQGGDRLLSVPHEGEPARGQTRDRGGVRGRGTPNVRAANGGLDANWMVRHGIPTVTFGAGQNEAHTIDEWINLDEYDRACALALQLATMR